LRERSRIYEVRLPMAMSQTRVTFSSFLIALVGLGACASEAPMEPSIVAQRAALYFRNAGLQTSAGIGFAGGQNSTVRTISTEMQSARDDLQSALPQPLPSPLVDALMNNSFVKALLDSKSTVTLDQRINDVSINLERWVKERLLAEANLKMKTDTDAVYVLKGDPTCRPLVAPGAPVPEVDADCQTELEKIQVTVLMKAILDGVALTFGVGPDNLEMSHIIVRQDGLEWRADWSKASIASDFVNATLGKPDEPNATKYRKLAGKTVLTIRKEAQRGVSITGSITEPLEAIKIDKDKKDTSSLTLASSPTPIISLTGDGATQNMSLELVFGAGEFKGPWDPNKTGAVNIDHRSSFSSFTARGRLTEKTKTIELSELILNDYVEEVRGLKTLTTVLNPGAMGKVNILAQVETGGLARFEISPKLELVADFKMGQLAGDFTGVKPYLPDEVFNVLLGGAAGGAPVQARLLKQGNQFAGVEVGAGNLSITTNKSSASVAVPSGKCLTRAKAPTTNAHPLLRNLAVVDCPRPTTGGNP
jgi:hypothetical protein